MDPVDWFSSRGVPQLVLLHFGRRKFHPFFLLSITSFPMPYNISLIFYVLWPILQLGTAAESWS
jgi:hypothetical protein